MIRPDKTLDVTGLASPRPETIAGNTLLSMEPGRVLTVITTDRTAGQNLPLLCERLGCTVLGLEENRGTISVHIRKNAPKAKDAQDAFPPKLVRRPSGPPDNFPEGGTGRDDKKDRGPGERPPG